MKILASLTYAPHSNEQKPFNSVSEAVKYFDAQKEDYLLVPNKEEYVMYLYGVDSCGDSVDNPFTSYKVGKRGGTVKHNV